MSSSLKIAAAIAAAKKRTQQQQEQPPNIFLDKIISSPSSSSIGLALPSKRKNTTKKVKKVPVSSDSLSTNPSSHQQGMPQTLPKRTSLEAENLSQPNQQNSILSEGMVTRTRNASASLSPSRLLEEKIIILSQLESERDEKRQELERVCSECQTLQQKMKQLETDLLGLDNDIDELERQVEMERISYCAAATNANGFHHSTPTETVRSSGSIVSHSYGSTVELKSSKIPTENGGLNAMSIHTNGDTATLQQKIMHSTTASNNTELNLLAEESAFDASKYTGNERKGMVHCDDQESFVLMDDTDLADCVISEFTQTQHPDQFYKPQHHHHHLLYDDHGNDGQQQQGLLYPIARANGKIKALELEETTTKTSLNRSGSLKQQSKLPQLPHQQSSDDNISGNQKNQNGSIRTAGTLDAYFSGVTSNSTNDLEKPAYQISKNPYIIRPSSTSGRSSISESTSINSNVTTNVKNTSSNRLPEKNRYPWSEQVDHLLHTTFQIPSFRDHQRDIINATLSGEDVFVIMRTGGGKSLTYQLPALLEGRYYGNVNNTNNKGGGKVTFVVSPLLSLIEDQEEQMNKFCPGSATSFTSGLSGGNTEHANRWNRVRDPNAGVCLVFITPEKVHQSNKLCTEMEKLFSQNRLGRFVIDECHCACQWGHDFRPDYAKLGKLKAHFPTIPIMAVTATASERVRQDVCSILGIGKSFKFFRSTANRPNLNYSVRPKMSSSDASKGDTSVIVEMANYIKLHHPRGAAGIVYTYSRKDADQVASSLCDYGIIARPYHSEITAKQKSVIHRSWMNNETQVIVATIAFGLGINKPDVRFVLHHSISKTLEAYYQESGRAGRDGKPADCILYYSPKDFTRLLKMVHGTSSEKLLLPMVRYAQASGNDALCKAIILKHLGEPNCPDVKEVELANEGLTTIRRDVGVHAKTVTQLLNLRLNERTPVTCAMLTKDWRSTNANTPQFVKDNPPAKDGLSVDDCERIIISLILENVIQTSPVWNQYDTVIYLTLGPFAPQLLQSANPQVIVKLPRRDCYTSTTNAATTSAAKQATARRSLPKASGQEWLSAAKEGPRTNAITKARKTTTKKKKAVRNSTSATKTPKRPPTISTKGTTAKNLAATKVKTISASPVTRKRAVSSEVVIDLLSDEDEEIKKTSQEEQTGFSNEDFATIASSDDDESELEFEG